MTFPQDFVWGAAAASYQIEGAVREDGKGPSVWDMFAHRPGKVWNDHNGDVACDHYHRYAEDVALMKRIGLHAYRLSICWPRVLPQGTGRANPAGLDFYSRLVDELLGAGITPYVTLFHWDYPYELYCRGGWLNRDSADWFAEYCGLVVRHLGDRVRDWITLNEPSIFIVLGHQDGRHAPGDKLGGAEVLRIAHHTFLAHGKAVQAIRAASPAACHVGIAPNMWPLFAANPAEARNPIWEQANFGVRPGEHMSFGLYNDPVLLGQYPAGVEAAFGAAPPVRPGDMETMHQPLDFLGLNIYAGLPMTLGPDGIPQMPGPIPAESQRTYFEWPVTPDALYWGPKYAYERYKLPIFITENGMSNLDWVTQDGKVHDPQRIDYLSRYLRSLRRATLEGVEVRGYFQWSIMDNFEWGEGYKHRFGLVYVNFATQQRILKDSAYWYRDLIATNGASLGE